MPTQPLPPKKEVALALLERTSVFVHLDPRVASVVVPLGFKKQAQLVLQVGLNMPVPIRDLQLDDEGMTCTLSFNRTPFFCVVPWASVYAVVGCDDGRGMIWPDDVPPEVAQAQARSVEAPKPAVAAVDSQRPRPREIQRERESETGSTAAKAKRSRKRPVLGAVPNPPSAADAASPRPQRIGSSAAAERGDRDGRDSSEDRPAERPAVSAISASRSVGAGGARRAAETGRRKRELPPYLRVVK